MKANPTSRRNPAERGAALLISLIMAMVVMGLVATLAISSQVTAQQSQQRVEYSRALEVADLALKRKIADIFQTTVTTANQAMPDGSTRSERVDLVGANLANPATGYFADFNVALGSYACTVRIYSAYYAHRNGLVGSDFLESVNYADRMSDSAGVFDVYKLVAVNSLAGVGQHQFRRGVLAVIQVNKSSVVDVPSPLYIDADPDPQLPSNAFTIKAEDHNLPSASSRSTSGSSADQLAQLPPNAEQVMSGQADLLAYNDQAANNSDMVADVMAGRIIMLAAKDDDKVTGADKKDDGGTTDGGSSGETGGQTDDSGLATGVAADAAQFSIAWNPALEAGGHDVYGSQNVNLAENDAQVSTLNQTTGAEVVGRASTGTATVDLNAMAEAYLSVSHTTITGAQNHNDVEPAFSGTSMNNFPIIHVQVSEGHKLTLSGGSTEGYGVLIVDGDLHITGQFSWKGLIIHRGGELYVTGGGNNPAKAHVFGALLTTANEVKMTGNADIWWCTETLNQAKQKVTNALRLSSSTMVWYPLNSGDLSDMGL